jgi:hypothetical protein
MKSTSNYNTERKAVAPNKAFIFNWLRTIDEELCDRYWPNRSVPFSQLLQGVVRAQSTQC